MPATVRTRDQIRESILARWRTAFAPRRLVTTPRSFVWALADALALEQEGAEATAAAATLEAFPESASEDGVLVHADFSGLDRQPATAAVMRARVVGSANGASTVPAEAELIGPTGLIYRADAATLALDGSGYGFITVRARDVGAAGNLTSGAVLTWVSAPAGLTSTATVRAASGDVTPLLVAGADQESIEELRARAILARKEKAQGGNRADWVRWAVTVAGVGSAYCYPRSRRTALDGGGFAWSYGVPGSLVVLPLAPAPGAATYVQNADGTMGLGLDPTFTRIPSSELRAIVREYVEGTVDAAGLTVPEAAQQQLRPASLAPGSYEIGAAGVVGVNVTLRVTTDPAIAPWPWGFGPGEGLHREILSATTTTLTLNSVTGIATGKRLAVFLGTSVVRGGWWVATVAYVAGSVVTLSTPLPSVPSAGVQKVRPDCGLWTEIRRRLLAHFDRLGPGDTQVPNDGTYPDPVVTQIMCARYPRPNDAGRDRVYASDLIAVVEGIPGVIAVTLDGFSAPVVPASGSLAVVDEIRVLAQV